MQFLHILIKDSVTEKISATASDGKNYLTQFYNLDAIISVGYRVNSIRATQFRQWATSVLRQYAVRGYVIDRKRMENGTYLGEDYHQSWNCAIDGVMFSMLDVMEFREIR